MKPLCVDLFCGLGGWSEGFLAEGYECIGFDVERHDYGSGGYPGQLVLQDVLTIHGSQFRNAAVIVASPPCQEFSFMAMPFSRGKRIAAALRGECEFPEGYTGSRTVDQLCALFNACFRIQREASEAAGRHIPMVLENVRGAQPWVGRAEANYGSFFLWGDVCMVGNRIFIDSRFDIEPLFAPNTVGGKRNPDGTAHGQGSWFAVADSKNRGAQTVPGFNFHQHENGQPGRSFQSAAVKATGHVNKRDGYSHARHLTNQRESDAVKQHGSGPVWFDTGIAAHSSKSSSRKAASAQIAKIPFALSNWIARVYDPRKEKAA